MSQSDWDIVVVGGGAAGYFAAITIAEQASGSPRILVAEGSRKVLEKVRISGGGRCNVTHDCRDARDLSKNYPRGERALIGPFHRWAVDQTIDWFESRGISLKVERDGRMFPDTDDSQTIIDLLTAAADELGIQVETSLPIGSIKPIDSGFRLDLDIDRDPITTTHVVLAMGGTRAGSVGRMLDELDIATEPPVPSLFTFKIDDPELKELAGVSVTSAKCRIAGLKQFETIGPVLITHWGLSGPGVLKLSALAARELAERDYEFEVLIDWLPSHGDPVETLERSRTEVGRRKISAENPFPELPKRLWQLIVNRSGIDTEQVWARLRKSERNALADSLRGAIFPVLGKSMNKEEFVTCGGIRLPELDMKTMEHRRIPGLYAVGEILDIDGVTGGFNFQNAWTTGHQAGVAIADRIG